MNRVSALIERIFNHSLYNQRKQFEQLLDSLPKDFGHNAIVSECGLNAAIKQVGE